MSPDHHLDVSRETLDRLRAFADLVTRWTAKINLVSKPSVPALWERHIVDSAQLFALADTWSNWVDLGSGGGFPGLVIACMAADNDTDRQVTLVESDQRKSAFLRSAIRELALPAKVIAKRIEAIEPLNADILSARALTDLDGLLGYAEQHLTPTGIALFPKGANWKSEDAAARKQWSYHCEAITSKTNPDAAVLKIKEIVRV